MIDSDGLLLLAYVMPIIVFFIRQNVSSDASAGWWAVRCRLSTVEMAKYT